MGKTPISRRNPPAGKPACPPWRMIPVCVWTIWTARRESIPPALRLTVLEKLRGVPEEQRGAHFVSAVCCVFPSGDRIDAEGKCFGAIAQESRGENGFGYDSIFVQDGRTFGEMSDQEKDARSHRGKAFEEFERKLKEYLEGLEKESV